MRLRRIMLVCLAQLGILMSLSTVTAMPMESPASKNEQHACYTPQHHTTPAKHDDHSDCGGKCIAACCRVISTTVDIDVKLSGEAPPISPTSIPPLVVLCYIDPDSIFHPPRF